MIIVRFTSGLGNQMFQYNLYSSLKERFPDTKVLADVTWFNEYSEHQGYELDRLFNREDNKSFLIDYASRWDIFCCSGQFSLNGYLGVKREVFRYINRILRLFSFEKLNRKRIDQTGFEDNADIYKAIEEINPKYNYYITGFFIEEIYYDHRLAKIRDFFSFDKNELGEKNANYVNQINGSNAVSLHVRRGDYLSDTYKDSFKSLGADYYKNAVDEVYKRIENPTFFIFSDDKDFINESFNWLENKIIVEGNAGNRSYIDMYLMSLCRINIIANSTFSMWAGILNSHEDATVIYLSTYMTQKESEVKLLKNWIRI